MSNRISLRGLFLGRVWDMRGADRKDDDIKKLIEEKTEMVCALKLPPSPPTPIYHGLSLNAFPTELLLDIFSYLPYWDANVHIPRVNKRFYHIIRAEQFNVTSRLRVDHYIRGNSITSRQRAFLTFPLSKRSEERIERIKFHAKPGVVGLTCHYTRDDGLSCYWAHKKLDVGDTSANTSPILLEPIVSPVVPKVRVKVDPMKYFRAPEVIGGSALSKSPGAISESKQAVTVLDLVSWLAKYLQEKTMIFEKYECFGFSLAVDNISSKGDACADLYVKIYYVDFQKFQKLSGLVGNEDS